MTTSTGKGRSAAADPRYRDNFSRHVLGLARYFQRSMMTTLRDEYGHQQLRLGYAPYITLLGSSDMRLTELAEAIGISRQACNQAVKQITAGGYIDSKPDPSDGRARQLVLSAKGRSLLADGAEVVQRLDQRFRGLVGKQAFEEACASLRKLHRGLELTAPNVTGAPDTHPVLGGLLPMLSVYIVQHLMELTIDHGHPGLKFSFGQVLMLIGPSGGRIQQRAAVHDVSKQASSAIATELEELGYITREVDQDDARQVVLWLTADGRQLIADSVQSLEQMEREFRQMLGKRGFQRLASVVLQLCKELQIDQEYSLSPSAENLQQLARRLRKQLGEDGSHELARLLLETG